MQWMMYFSEEGQIYRIFLVADPFVGRTIANRILAGDNLDWSINHRGDHAGFATSGADRAVRIERKIVYDVSNQHLAEGWTR